MYITALLSKVRSVATTVTFGLVLIAAFPADAGAAPSTPPKLHISLTDGQASTRPGQGLGYDLTIQNLSAEPVSGLFVTQTVPTGLVFGSAHPDAAMRDDHATWRIDLKGNGTTTVHTTMKVTATPDQLLRLASVACAATSAKGAPVVCASDSDQLPAGARAAQLGADTTAVTGSSGGNASWYIGGGGVVVAVALGAVVARFRRGRQRSTSS